MGMDLIARGLARKARTTADGASAVIDLFQNGASRSFASDIVMTGGYSVRGKGAARYAYDPAVNPAFVSANPRTAFLDASGRGYRLAEAEVTVQMFGARGDGTTDDTAAIQAAFDALAAGKFNALLFPDGIYILSAKISISQTVIQGWRVRGQSRSRTIIRQTAANTPHFEITCDQMHSCLFECFAADWSASQVGNNQSAVFRFLPLGSLRSVYNSSFRDLYVSNAYWFMRGETALFWGNSVRDVTCVTGGGFVNLAGTAGQPKNAFDNIYINGGAAGEFLFRVDAMVADYFVEVNNCAAGMMRDLAGGSHSLRHFALEKGNFTSNTTLFDVPNSRLHAAGTVYAQLLTLAAGVQVIGFSNSGTNALINVREFVWSFFSGGQGANSKFYVYNGNPGYPAIFDYVVGPFSAPAATPVSALTDIGSTGSAEFVRVTSWTDPNRIAFAGDADYTMTHNGHAAIVFGTALTAARKVTLPYAGMSSGNNLFRGKTFDIVKLPSAGTAFPINVYKADGTTLVATIPAATASGTKRIWFSRIDPATGSSTGALVISPLPV